MHRSTIAAALVGIVLILGAAAVQAGTIMVDSIADDTAPDHCTLREAINETLAKGDRGTCRESSPGVSMIKFNSSLAGQTIALKSTLPAIIYDLTITGPTISSAGIIISGNNSNQILRNDRGSLQLQYLTLSNGRSAQGGAIYNRGLLTISNCSTSSNQAVGSIVASGGAIYLDSGARLTVTNCTVSSNSVNSDGTQLNWPHVFQGGAFSTGSQSLMTITNSTFADDAVSDMSASPLGLARLAQGGAINSSGTLTIINSTFSGNKALTAISSGEGGAIYANPRETTTIHGTILANSTRGNCYYHVTAPSYDLCDDASCRFSGTSRDNVTDIDLDTGLKNNGGPTQTIALTSVVSAAVDLIPPQDCPKTDQRGFLRPASGQARCDAGAFELGATP
jgi:hypothetical protein